MIKTEFFVKIYFKSPLFFTKNLITKNETNIKIGQIAYNNNANECDITNL